MQNLKIGPSENLKIWTLILIYFPVHFVTGSLQKRRKFGSLEGRMKKDYLHWVASFAYIGVNTNQAAAVSAVGCGAHLGMGCTTGAVVARVATAVSVVG